MAPARGEDNDADFAALAHQEKGRIKNYIESYRESLSKKYGFSLTPSRIDLIGAYYGKHVTDVGTIIDRVKSYYEEIKTVELSFYKDHDINIVLQEDAADYLAEKMAIASVDFAAFYEKFSTEFGLGLKLVRDKVGTNRFFIDRKALMDPDVFISDRLKDSFAETPTEP